MIPKKLKKGDEIRVIAPSESIPDNLTDKLKQRGIDRLKSLGLKVSFGKYVEVSDDFDSASIEQRLEDLHAAFKDPSVSAILAVIGGSSANQILKDIDYDLIKDNPKIFCGLSDLTELSAAIYQRTGVVSYYGPHFTMLCSSKIIDYSLENMKEMFFSNEPVKLKPSKFYLNDTWDDEMILNSKFWTINEGEAEGECIGGNLMTFNFMLGNSFSPDIRSKILYIEENHIIDFKGVQKELQEILNHPDSNSIKGIIIGRFQKKTGMSRELLTKMIKSKKQLKGIPVIGNVDISHTSPIISLPYGGKMKMKAGGEDKVSIIVNKH